jgi:hypothetical protein
MDLCGSTSNPTREIGMAEATRFAFLLAAMLQLSNLKQEAKLWLYTRLRLASGSC